MRFGRVVHGSTTEGQWSLGYKDAGITGGTWQLDLLLRLLSSRDGLRLQRLADGFALGHALCEGLREPRTERGCAGLHPLLTDLIGCEDNPTFMAFGEQDRPGRLGISPRDFARFGLLYLRGGMWNGKQLTQPGACANGGDEPGAERDSTQRAMNRPR